MINSVSVTNHLGETLVMELRFPEKSGFLVRDIDGLGPSKANINTTEVATIDGAVFNSARLTSRNIVFNLMFLEKPTVEMTRQLSYKYFPVKKRIKIQINTDYRVSEIYGYVETNVPDIFSREESAVISVICPDPNFYSVSSSTSIFSGLIPLFEFPFSNELTDGFTVGLSQIGIGTVGTAAELIEYNSAFNKKIIFGEISPKLEETVIYSGDASVGVRIYIHALGTVTNLSIINNDTREVIKILDDRLVSLTGSGIIEGDDIIISTVKGDKFVMLQRGGDTINILNALDRNPNWFQLERGDNVFSYVADFGISNLQFRIDNQVAYEGV